MVEALLKVARRWGPPEDEILVWVRLLGSPAPPAQTLAETLRIEAHLSLSHPDYPRNVLDDEGGAPPLILSDEKECRLLRMWTRWRGSSPSRMLANHRAFWMHLVHVAETSDHPDAIHRWVDTHLWTNLIGHSDEVLLFVLCDDPMGLVYGLSVFEEVRGDWEGVWRNNQSRIAATLYLAACVHRSRTGTWPAELADLLPLLPPGNWLEAIRKAELQIEPGDGNEWSVVSVRPDRVGFDPTYARWPADPVDAPEREP